MPYKVIGKVTVPAPGTPVPLYAGSADFRCNAIVIQARSQNAGTVYIGDKALNKGTELYAASLDAKQSYTIGAGGNGNVVDPSTIYVDADTAGDGVRVSFVQY